MIGPDSVLAIIPCRARSERLPGKNTAFCGEYPLIVGTIKQAQASRYINTIAVTTDDRNVDALAFSNGADVIIRRPDALATADSTSESAVVHAMNMLAEHAIIVLLQVTSPLRTVADIDACIENGRQWKCVSTCDGKANGAVYVARWVAFEADPSFSIGKGVVSYPMPAARSVDIDTFDDLQKARNALSVHSMMGA